MKKWVLPLLLGTTLVLGACGGGGDSGNNDGNNETADPAEDVYQQSCAACHGADLEGANGPELDDVGSKYSADEIEDIIVNGTGDMPPQNVEGDDLDALVEWLADKE